MQKHLEKLPPVPFDQQIIRACDWVSESLFYDKQIFKDVILVQVTFKDAETFRKITTSAFRSANYSSV